MNPPTCLIISDTRRVIFLDRTTVLDVDTATRTQQVRVLNDEELQEMQQLNAEQHGTHT